MTVIGTLLLLFGSNGLGYCLCRRKVTRRKQTEELAELLELMQAEIRCHQSMLAEAFLAISDRLPGWRYFFLQELLKRMEQQDGSTFVCMWKQSVNCISGQTWLTGEEIRLWQEVGERIGFLDLQMQDQVLAQYIQRLRRIAAELEREEVQSCKLYRVLSVAGGLLAAVLLL